MIETLLQDIRFAIRSLAAHRGSAMLAVLCLTLGIGTNAAVFTFVNALLLRPVPIAAAEELLVVREARRDAPETGEPASYANFRDWQQAVADVAELAALRTISVRLADGGPPERYAAALVSSNLFSVLGIQPALGRGFLAEELESATPGVLVSHALWQQRFEADPRLLGRAISINGVAYRVVGVMPPAASALAMQPVLRGSKLWLPLDPSERASRRDQRRLTVYARPHDGVTSDATRVRLVTVARALEDEFRAENEGWGVSLQPLRIGFSTTTQTLLWMVMGAVTFVLLIACTNVANLTLARATGRRHEMATQLALGASNVRIVRQLLTESLIVAAVSVPLGIAVANWCRQMLLSSVATPDLAAGIDFDRQVLAFIVGLAVLSTAGSGLAPALVVLRRLSANTFSMRGDRQGAALPHAYITKALLVGEVALSIVLLVGAALFLQSFRNLLAAEGGFDTSRILVARLGMTEEGERPDENSVPRVFGLVDRLRSVPGVEVGAAANLMPLRDGGIRGVVVPDQMVSGDAKAPVLLGGITADFFAALDVPLLQGRRFTEAEGRSRAPVAIVNKTMARRFWLDGNPVGRSFRRLVDGNESSFTVIGVSKDILTWDLSNRPVPTAYLPYSWLPAQDPTLLLRASGSPALLAAPARSAIRGLEPALPILDALTMTEVHYMALSRQQTVAATLSVLGVVALLLGATGVYGVFSYFVSQRRHEIGVRAALGADRRTLVSAIVKEGMILAAIGAVAGGGGAFALGRVLRGQLHQVSPADPVSFAVAVFVVMLVAFAATFIPAHRAGSVDPLIAIRE